MASVPGSGRSSGGGNGNPLQYSCLENCMDRGTGRATDIGLQRVRYNWSEHSTRNSGGNTGKLLCPAQNELIKSIYAFKKPMDPLAVDSGWCGHPKSTLWTTAVFSYIAPKTLEIHWIQWPIDKMHGNGNRQSSHQHLLNFLWLMYCKDCQYHIPITVTYPCPHVPQLTLRGVGVEPEDWVRSQENSSSTMWGRGTACFHLLRSFWRRRGQSVLRNKPPLDKKKL